MTITLYKNADDPRTIQKTLTAAKAVTANIKNDVSIMQPEFYVTDDSIISGGYNYAEAFGRYYFITDITVTPAQSLRIQCREDVLFTHAAAILASPAVCVRNSSAPNTYIDDPRLPLEKYKNQQVLAFTSFVYQPQTVIVCVG